VKGKKVWEKVVNKLMSNNFVQTALLIL